MSTLETLRQPPQAAVALIHSQQRFVRNELEAKNSLAKTLKNFEPTRRMIEQTIVERASFDKTMKEFVSARQTIDSAIGKHRQLLQMAEEASRAQRLIMNQTIGASASFEKYAQAIGPLRKHYASRFGSTKYQHLEELAAINRSISLFPHLAATSTAIVNTMVPTGTSTPNIPADDSKWTAWLKELKTTLETAIEAVEERIDQRALLRFLPWLFSILLAAYAIREAEISSDQLNSRVDGLPTVFEALISDLLERFEADNTAQYYIVARVVPMTEDRKYHGIRIIILLPGQEVEVVERSGKWLRVIAYGLESGETHIGWVLKKYLNRVTDEGAQGPELWSL
ncbi:MAG: hypothetical protein ACTSX7_07025 [Alphaproteobacteria bacterium]